MPHPREQSSGGQLPAEIERDPDALARRAAAAGTEEERRAALEEGVTRHGLDFLGAVDQFAPELGEEAQAVFVLWLRGASYTERADEDERRAQAALELLDDEEEDGEVAALVAGAILRLPDGHPDRDLELARGLLETARTKADEESDGDAELGAIGLTLREELEPAQVGEELIERGLELLGDERDDGAAEEFLGGALSYSHKRAMDARDADEPDDEGFARWIAFGDDIVAIRAPDGDPAALDDPLVVIDIASHNDLGEHWVEAADMYRRFSELTSPDDATTLFAPRREGELRLRLGDYRRAIDLLGDVFPRAEELYLTAVLGNEVAEAGDQLADVGIALAVACASADQWDAAFRALDSVKSRRLRHAAALRQTSQGRELLELERLLDASSRGVAVQLDKADDSADALWGRLETRLLEAYRRARPHLPSSLTTSPSVAELAAVLDPDEAVVALASHWKVTLALLVTADDTDRPSGCHLDEEKSLRDWVDTFKGEEGMSWILAINEPGYEDDGPPALEALLEDADRLVGRAIGRMVPPGVRRLTVIPHALLHLVPWWAVVSLAPFDVTVAPSAAQLVEARRRGPARLGSRAVVVSDPTLDLPAALAETTAVAARLGERGLAVEFLSREGATEKAVTAALADASLLHFSGHGHSNLETPARSALRVAPAAGFAAAAGALASAAGANVGWTVEVEGEEGVEERVVSVPSGDGGRLFQTAILDETRVERRLERLDETLWGTYADEQLTSLGELWTAGEIMLEDSFGACELAVLSACESGIGGAAAVDEHAGLTAALQQAGVRTIVATLWPVLDPVAALFADLLYEEFGAAESRVDAVSLVASASDRLRLLGTREARTRLLELGRASGEPRALLTLEAFAHALGTEDERPFEHPWHWAAFYATGHPTILIEEEAPA